MINTYSYYVMRGKNFPLHIVEIHHMMLDSFSVFSNSKDAIEYIKREKESLKKYAPLEYDSEMKPAKGLYSLYKNTESGMFSDVRNHKIYIK